jgi:hypothetical protein
MLPARKYFDTSGKSPALFHHHALDALRIYYFMSDGDPSLDGGYLGKRIAQCYEALGELDAAKYWYGRAIEENPVVNSDCADARNVATPSISSRI